MSGAQVLKMCPRCASSFDYEVKDPDEIIPYKNYLMYVTEVKQIQADQAWPVCFHCWNNQSDISEKCWLANVLLTNLYCTQSRPKLYTRLCRKTNVVKYQINRFGRRQIGYISNHKQFRRALRFHSQKYDPSSTNPRPTSSLGEFRLWPLR